jgi:hypothetical protein
MDQGYIMFLLYYETGPFPEVGCVPVLLHTYILFIIFKNWKKFVCSSTVVCVCYGKLLNNKKK